MTWVILVTIGLMTAGAIIILNHPAFGKLPKGSRLERIRQSSHYNGDGFVNLTFTPTMTTDKGFIRSMWDYLFNKPKDTAPAEAIPTVKTDLKALERSDDVVIWLGHSSLYIQQDGQRMLVDPVLTNEFPASMMMTPFKGTMIYGPDDMPDIDVLLITHDHWDHLDYGTVRRLRERTGRVICPLGVGAHLEHWDYPPEKIVEVDWHDEVTLNDSVKVTAIPSRHFSGRGMSRNKTLWCGYMIEGSRKMYISGDGGYDNHFKAVARDYPVIDLAIMENGQYNEAWKHIHLMPDDLQKAVADLNARRVMTVHNSKYSLAPHPWKEPLQRFSDFADADSLPLFTPAIGEPLRPADVPAHSHRWWTNVR